MNFSIRCSIFRVTDPNSNWVLTNVLFPIRFVGLLTSCMVTVVVACLLSSAEAQQGASPSNTSNPWTLNFGHQPRPQDARTVIDAQDGVWFDDVTNTVEFFGKVVVRDPQFTLTCDRLNVVINKNRQGLQLITATGNVHIDQQGESDSGEKVKSTGQAGVAIYEPATGDITLKVWPQVRQGKNYQVATEAGTVMVLNNKGTFRAQGQTRTTILDVGEQGK